MEITNRGYVNFNNDYNRKEINYCTASMSFNNGKDENGDYKSGYIGVVAFGELGDILFNNSGNLVTVSGYYRLNEHEGNKYPQVIITAINGYAPQNNQNRNNNNQGNYNQQPTSQSQGNFGGQQQNYGNQDGNFQNGNNQGGYQSPFDTSPRQGSFFQGQTTNPMDISDDDLPF